MCLCEKLPVSFILYPAGYLLIFRRTSRTVFDGLKMKVSPKQMKVTLQHKPADRLCSCVCFTATMTQKVPQIPAGARTVTCAVSLHTLSGKEPGYLQIAGVRLNNLWRHSNTRRTHRGQGVLKGLTRVSGGVRGSVSGFTPAVPLWTRHGP